MMHSVRKGSYMPDTFRSGLIRGDIEESEPWKSSAANQEVQSRAEHDESASHSNYEVDQNDTNVWDQPGAERFFTQKRHLMIFLDTSTRRR